MILIRTDLWIQAFLLVILVIICMEDIAKRRIPNRCILAGMLLWLLQLLFAQGSVAGGSLFSLSIFLLRRAAAGLLISGGTFLTAALIAKLLGSRVLGGGDIKLLFLCGLYLDPDKGLFMLFAALFFSLAAGFALACVWREKPWKITLPCAPFICLAFLVFLWR